MGYSGQNAPTPARNIRILLGFKLALVCLVIGSLVTTHGYNRALTMSETPAEMEWETLNEDGLSDTSFITLTNVELVGADTEEELADMVDAMLDSEADPADIEAAFAMDADEELGLGELADVAMTPVFVVPIGSDPDSPPQTVYIPRNGEYLAEAKAQLDEFGTLTGYVSSLSEDVFVRMFFDAIGVEADEEEFGLEDDDQIVYTFYPMEEPLNKSEAETPFWLCGLGVAAGLILCCSGGPTFAFCIFFSVPAVVSLLGYPMRYGRGGVLVRVAYGCAGIGLMGLGYKLMVLDGQFGTVNANPFLYMMGYAIGFIGLAAFMAVPIQVLCRKFVASTEVKPRKQEKKMSYEAACSLEPPKEDEDDGPIQYEDGALIQIQGDENEALEPTLQEASEALEPLGFISQLPVQWQYDGEVTPTFVALGCDNMVVADIEVVDGERMVQLYSVLHDGLTVITVSKNSPVHQDRRLGTNGYYSACRSNDPIDVISQHLEETAELSGKRDTTVVKIDTDETREVCFLVRRVLTDVRAQYGEIEAEVGSQVYGRFKFPTQRVIGELASL